MFKCEWVENLFGTICIWHCVSAFYFRIYLVPASASNERPQTIGQYVKKVPSVIRYLGAVLLIIYRFVFVPTKILNTEIQLILIAFRYTRQFTLCWVAYMLPNRTVSEKVFNIFLLHRGLAPKKHGLAWSSVLCHPNQLKMKQLSVFKIFKNF